MPGNKGSQAKESGAEKSDEPKKTEAKASRRKETHKSMAPPKCEVCDKSLPAWADREAHMKETNHCECFQCGGYIPPGYVYVHWGLAHDDIYWNDHHIASGDRSTLHDALPWVWKNYETANKCNLAETYGWRGDHSQGPSPDCDYCKVYKQV